MICVEYAIYNQEYRDALDNYHNILLEQEQIFNETQPKSFRYDRDKVQSNPVNPLEKYIEKKEARQIEERLKEARAIVIDRGFLLNAKKKELVESKNVNDLVYRYKYIEGIKTSHICDMLGYSKSQINKILLNIDNKTKSCVKMSQNEPK